MTAVFDNGMNGTGCITSEHGWKYDDVLYDLGLRFADVAKQDYVINGDTLEQIFEAKRRRAGRPGGFGLEAATMIENELDRIDILYGFGVRQMGIAYSQANTARFRPLRGPRRRVDPLRPSGPWTG